MNQLHVAVFPPTTRAVEGIAPARAVDTTLPGRVDPPGSATVRRPAPLRARRMSSWPWLALAALAGCASTRPLPPQPPSIDVPAEFKEGTSMWQSADPGMSADGAAGGAAARADWWTVFGDPRLDALQEQLVIGNEDLRAALARVASARATLANSRAALLPTVGLGLSGTRSGQSGSSSFTTIGTGTTTTGGTTGTPTTGTGGSTTSSTGTAIVSNSRVTNLIDLSANASWEVDLWGRLAEAARSSDAALQASADDLAAAQLSAQSTLVQLYFTLRSTDAALDLLERTQTAYEQSLQLTQNRYKAGVAGQVDVAQAQTQLYTTQAQRRDTEATRQQTEHAIALLLGRAPAAVTLPASADLPAAPSAPRLVPTTLLQRRPDIAAAERRVAAANAQIGVARAAFFPALTLSASAGYRDDGWRHLLNASNLVWSLGPALALTVFDGGAREAAVASARAAADLAASTYRSTVLTAFQEVEDNLTLADKLAAEGALQAQALDAAQRTLTITQNQYRAGTVSYQNVVTAQITAFSAERTLIDVRNRQLAATGILLKNLGGDWQSATVPVATAHGPDG